MGVILLLFNDMGIIKWYELRQEKKYLKMKIDQILLKEQKLSEELKLLENNEEYIKKIARERFYMVKPGEKVFRVVDRRKVRMTKR